MQNNSLIGKELTEDVKKQLPISARILRENCIYVKNVDPFIINVYVDQNNIITKLTVG